MKQKDEVVSVMASRLDSLEGDEIFARMVREMPRGAVLRRTHHPERRYAYHPKHEHAAWFYGETPEEALSGEEVHAETHRS